MRSAAISLLVLAASAVGIPVVQAAQYCAQYYNGTYDCGIPTLASCQQSVSGVGGTCVIDRRAQRRNRASGNPPPQRPFPSLFAPWASPNGN